MSGLRTTTGCWTCRIRKKKCDDGKKYSLAHEEVKLIVAVQPSCGPCTFRQVTCHGYGRKPAWMDSAENQKAEIERIKQAVNQNFRSRRAFRLSKKSTAQAGSERRKDVTSKSHLKHEMEFQDEGLPRKAGPLVDGLELGATALSIADPWPEPTYTSAYPLPKPAASYPSNLSSSGHSQEAIQTVYPFSFHPDAPPAENEHDLALIMNYLDNVFPLQFYFYQPSNADRGRGWLLSLLLRARSAYFTALAFSSLHQLIFVYKGDIIKERVLSADLDKYHTLALSELQKQLDYLPSISGYEHLKMGVEILACMLQLLSIEVFRETKEYNGWKDDWEVHLDAAGILLSVIGTDLRTSSSSSPASASSGDEDTALQATGAEKATPLLPLNEIAGLDFFMKVYVWGEVVRCASTGANTSGDSFEYLTYLKEDRIRLDHIMGCRNWAMIAIKEISTLEIWKKEMQRSRSLSIPMLSRKAAEIEQQLHVGLDSVLNGQDTLTKYEQECNLVTQLMALSAVTYLGIVVSGNSHHLPEIRSSVANSLKALKALPTHLLIRISWPYCVAGCMADESEKADFCNLLYDAHKNGHILGTLWNSLELVEEFWRLRENHEFMQTADKCAWALAMDNLGAKILII